MSMIKIIAPGSYDFQEPAAQLIKISSRGLRGHDLQQFVKRAGHRLADAVQGIDFASGEEPLHLMAVGATEDYGPNRNGDGFKRATCDNWHYTFKKYARFYRNHQNRDQSKSYGLIKLSMYHEPMKRIELVVGLNGTKEAAERNKGLLADLEMKKLANDEDIAVSMACKVAHDICSACGNKARNRSEYCTSIEEGGHCKAGGAKHNLGKVAADGHILHVDNPDPRFFDISNVFRPADRIAFTTGQLLKAAADGNISGAELAETLGISMPYELMIEESLPSGVARQMKLAYQLADIESLPEIPVDRYFALAFTPEVQPPITMDKERVRVKLAQAFRALADEKILLPLGDFIALMTDISTEKQAAVTAAVAVVLPGVYTRLLADHEGVAAIESNPYTPARSCSDYYRGWAAKQAADHSLRIPIVEKRAQLAALRRDTVPAIGCPAELTKIAVTMGPVDKLAKQYALYKLAFLSGIPSEDREFPLTAALCVLHNHV